MPYYGFFMEPAVPLYSKSTVKASKPKATLQAGPAVIQHTPQRHVVIVQQENVPVLATGLIITAWDPVLAAVLAGEF